MTPQEFVVLDIETTGVNPTVDDIIEFAAVKLNAKGEEIGRLEHMIATDKELVPIVISLTGITPDDLHGMPALESLMQGITDFIGDSPIVGHNISFDVNFLLAKGCPIQSNILLDTLELAQTFLPVQEGYGLEFFAKQYEFPSQPSHRAMDDVMATVNLMVFLINTAQGMSSKTKQNILSAVGTDKWSWGWVIDAPIWKTLEVSRNHNFQTTLLLNELPKAVAEAATFKNIGETGLHFVEHHLPVTSLAASLALATKREPSVLVVTNRQLKEIDWMAAGDKLATKITVHQSGELNYVAGSLELIAGDPEIITPTLARLMTKIIIWQDEWASDYNQLFLTPEESYQWEQKFSGTHGDAKSTLGTAAEGLVVLSPATFLQLEGTAGYTVVTSIPTVIEDTAYASQTRTFSINYFNAAISSRRDFVHTIIKPHDTGLADLLFKSLGHISTGLDELGKKLIQFYAAHPPSSPFNKDIELIPGFDDLDLSPEIVPILKNLTEYLEKIRESKLPDINWQIEHTEKLINYLEMLSSFAPEFRYFLFADLTKFYLDFAPQTPSFTGLTNQLTTAKNTIITAAGLSYGGDFNYFKETWGAFESTTLPAKNLTELLLVNDLVDDARLSGLHHLIEFVLGHTGKHLFVGSSGFEANQMFNQYFDFEGATVATPESVGRYHGFERIASAKGSFGLFGFFGGIERMKHLLPIFDHAIVYKIPFESTNHGRARGDDSYDLFESYSLPRMAFRFKEGLHELSLTGKPVILADTRLQGKGYGQKLLRSLPGFNIVPVGTQEIF